jgi:hypothetical protein
MLDTVCFYLGLVVVIQGCFCRIDRWNLHKKLVMKKSVVSCQLSVGSWQLALAISH